jgi:hypothetical protein
MTIGYTSSYSGEYFKDQATLSSEIRSMTKSLPIQGMIFEYLKYNLTQVVLYWYENSLFKIGATTGSGLSDLYDQTLLFNSNVIQK